MVAETMAVSIAEAQAYARIETGEEEALVAGFVRSASELCEQFVGQWLIERAFAVRLPATGGWQRLALLPVQSITEVALVASDGSETPLPVEAYAVDIDATGQGWLRLAHSSGTVIVRGRAGMAKDANGVPEPLRQGILRLVAHLLADRDDCTTQPPAAVTALWRPYRRMAL